MNKPVVNVLSRLSNQRLHTEMMIRSVSGQTYQPINHILGADVELDFMDESKYIKLKLPFNILQPPKGLYYAPHNQHMNTLLNEVKEGIIIALDYDDMYTREDSIETIVNSFDHENQLVIWRVQITPQFIVPSYSFGKAIMPSDISGIGFAYYYNPKLKVDWGWFSQGDYRVAKQLENQGLEVKWVNQILTKTISGPHNGQPIKYE
jgi:hypothetical protein